MKNNTRPWTTVNINKIQRVHTPKIQGRVFSEGSEAPQAAQHTRTLLGDPKTGKTIEQMINNKRKKNTSGTCSKIPETCFSEGSEAPQAAQHTRTLLRDPKTDKHILKINKYPVILQTSMKIHSIRGYPATSEVPRSRIAIIARIPGYTYPRISPDTIHQPAFQYIVYVPYIHEIHEKCMKSMKSMWGGFIKSMKNA